MASNHTPTYGLNQWSLEDSVIMEEFNTDNRNIEQALLNLQAAMPKIATGSYVGTGTGGAETPNTLTFDFSPKVIIITTEGLSASPSTSTSTPRFFVRPWKYANSYASGNTSSNTYYTYVTWLDKGVSWYSQNNDGDPRAGGQLNSEGVTYHYFAIG